MSKKVQIGKTNLFVNPIGLGTNYVGGHNIYPNVNEETGKEIVRTAIDNGLDFLDTAFIYGPERSEELIGEVLAQTGKRKDVVLATKAAHKFVGEDIVMDNSPAFLKQSVEDSLNRLQTDYIDLFYIHFPDDKTPKYEAVGLLKELKDEGKIRAIGVSNFSIEQLKEANQDGYVDVYQGEYNLLERSAEKELFPYVIQQHISFVPYFPFKSGLLTGKYHKNTVFQDGRAKNPHFQGETFLSNLDKVEKLKNIAADLGVEVAPLVLSWYLNQKAIDVVIPGAKKPEQIHSNLEAGDVQLSQKEIEAIDRVFS